MGCFTPSCSIKCLSWFLTKVWLSSIWFYCYAAWFLPPWLTTADTCPKVTGSLLMPWAPCKFYNEVGELSPASTLLRSSLNVFALNCWLLFTVASFGDLVRFLVVYLTAEVLELDRLCLVDFLFESFMGTAAGFWNSTIKTVWLSFVFFFLVFFFLPIKGSL